MKYRILLATLYLVAATLTTGLWMVTARTESHGAARVAAILRWQRVGAAIGRSLNRKSSRGAQGAEACLAERNRGGCAFDRYDPR